MGYNLLLVSGDNLLLVDGASQLLLVQNQPPDTPVITSLMGAANGGVADLALGGALVAPFSDPNVGDVVSAIGIRRKVGAGAYEYYNGTTWVAGATTKIAQAVAGYTFAAGKFASDGTVYQVGVRYEDASGDSSAWSTDITVTGSQPPSTIVTDPVSPVTTTNTPTVGWSFSDPEGYAQERARVIIEHGAYSTTPGSGTQDVDSGDLVSSPLRTWTCTATLANGVTYRAFVYTKATDTQAAAWAYRTFTLTLTPPSAPTMAVTPDAAQGRTAIAVTATHVLADFTAEQALVEYELDDGTWATVRGAPVTLDVAGHATVYDNEAPLNRARNYRATIIAEP